MTVFRPVAALALLVLANLACTGAVGAGQDAKRPHRVANHASGSAGKDSSPKGNGAGRAGADEPKAGALPCVPPVMTRLPGGGLFLMNTKGLSIRSAGDGIELRIGGRLHLDGSAADLRPGTIGPALSDDFRVRRAWLEAFLTIGKVFEAALQYDFSKTDQPINDAVLSYRGLDPVIFTIGNFKEPFSLDQLTSNNNTLFVERSLLDAFAPARDFGFAVGAHGERWTAVGGVYGGNANTDLASDGLAGTVRLTYAPLLSSDQVLHFGVAGSYRALGLGDTRPSFSSTPGDDLFSTALVDTGKLARAAGVGRIGLEALYQKGPYRIKAEYAAVDVGGSAGQSARLFQAAYVEAAWVVNGNGRPYELVPDYGSTYAVLGGVKVDGSRRVSHGGIGIFEVGARLDTITLTDGSTKGGSETDVALGVNWYPDSNVKVMADYVRAHADPTAATVTGQPADSDIFVGRLQLFW